MRREPLEAILLVGGQGTRLRPLTLSAPNPLLPTAGVINSTAATSRQIQLALWLAW